MRYGQGAGRQLGAGGSRMRAIGLAGRRRRRVRPAFAVLTMCVLCVVGVGFAGGRAPARAGETAYRVVVVREGDTIWDIADRVARADIDLRRVVFDIRRANALSTCVIRPGDVLKVPAIWCR